MHFRRVSSVVLGVWLGGALVVLLFSMQNTRLVDQLISSPSKGASDYMVKLQEADLRLLMNYHAAEGNLWLRGNWELTELGLGAILLVSLFFGSGGKYYTLLVTLLMILSAAFQHWFLTSEIAKLSQAAEFAQPDKVSLVRDRLGMLESGYTVSEMITLGLGVLLALGLVKRAPRRRHQPVETN